MDRGGDRPPHEDGDLFGIFLHPARHLLWIPVSILLYANGATSAAAADTVSVVSGPPSWTSRTTASFRFSTSAPTSVECRLDAQTDPAAPWQPCVDGHTIPGPLPEGRHVLEVRSAGTPDAPAEDSWVWRIDVTPPTVPRIFEPNNLWQKERNVSLSWGASDVPSGVGDYSVRYDRWGASGGARADIGWVGRSTITGATFLASPGRTYCFEAMARDKAGNPAPRWSSRRCFALPLDDRALERHGRWTRRDNMPGHYLDTYVQTTQRGAWARVEVVGKRFALVATKCPSCGSVVVRWRGRVVKKLSLRATAFRRNQLVPITSLARPQSGTLRLDVTSAGKGVRIEGVGVSRV
jgi:hypothetical protein